MKIGGYRSAFTPFTDALLAAKTLATVLPLYEQYQQGQQQNAVNASLAAGKPVTELPRTGFGALGAKLGLLSPTTAVDPATQNYAKLALQQEKEKAIPGVLEIYKTLGPKGVTDPAFSDMLKRSGLSASMFTGAGNLTPAVALAKSLGLDTATVNEIASLPPAQQDAAVKMFEGTPQAKAAISGAEEQRKIDVRNAPENVAATASAAGTIQAARTAAEKPQVVFRYEMDPTGATIQVPYRVNRDGSLTRAVMSGDSGGVMTPSGNILAKLDAQQQKQLDSVRNVRQQIPRIETIVNDLPPDLSAAAIAKEYAKYRAPFGALGTVDPRLANYFQTLGQIKTDLTASAMGGSRGKYLFDYLKPHIPNETDPPARALEKLRGFDEGRFNALMQNYLGGATAPGPITTAPPPPKPPFTVSRSFTKGADWYVQGTDGRFYQFDKANNQWRPL